MMEEVLSAPLMCATKDLQQQNQDKSYEIYLLKHKLQQELNQELERYLSVLNHDIKPPVLAQIYALKRVITNNINNLTPIQKTLLEMTIESCQKQYLIINNLITTIKYKQDSVILNPSWFNLADLLNEHITSLQEYERTIKFISVNSNLKIKADRKNFSNAIYNILKNAVEQSVSGSEIRISLEKFYENQLSINIDWEGFSDLCGFTYKGQDNQLYIYFDNYSAVGSGLDIELAVEIIKSHGGKINSRQSGNIKSIEIILPIMQE